MKKRTHKKTRSIILLIFISIFLISSIILSWYFYNQYKENEEFKTLSTNISSNISKKETKFRKNILQNTETKNEIIKETKNKPQKKQKILSKYKELYEENNELYGWIKIKGTNIDYPVMYSPDEPQFYLHRNFNKEDSFSGTPFILVPDTNNIIIYGHNMKNKTMFSALRNYKDIEFWKENPYIEFDTLYEKAVYEIFAVTNTVVYYDKNEIPFNAYLFYQHTNLETEKEFNDYIKNVQKDAYFDSKISPTFGDSIITLCTCDYVTKNARLLVIARKVQKN